MQKLLVVIITCLFCVSCGVKSNPEYKSQYNFIKNIKLI